MAEAAIAGKTWSVGTLTYSRKGLAWLFFWILLADFTLTIMEMVVPSLMPLELKNIGASNAIIGLVGTLSSAMNMVMNPIVSTASDRHRGPRGRRIPYLLWPTPLCALFLILTGYSPAIGSFLHTKAFSAWGVSEYAVTITLMFSCMVLFQVFHLFVGCVYWYIFADLVPHELMGRFLGLLRVVSQLAGFVWGAYIFGLADHYMAEIYLGAGLLYGISFMVFCRKVKEGEYPPPPPRKEGRGAVAAIKDYVRTCTSSALWWWVILAVVTFQVSQISNTYWTFFGRDTLGCSLDTIGKIAGWGSLIAIPLVMVVGWLTDRMGAIAMVLSAAVFSAVVSAFGYFQITGESSLMVYGILTVIGVVWVQQAMMPMYIMLFPPARYGQFCSAVNMMAMVAAIVFNYLMGVMMDWLNDYRYLMAWRAVSWGLMIPAVVMVWILYRRHGGPNGYIPPVDDLPASETVAAVRH